MNDNKPTKDNVSSLDIPMRDNTVSETARAVARCKDEIESFTISISWKNGANSAYHTAQSNKDLVYGARVMQMYVDNYLKR